ncbi:MAG TPA: hypothetical protein VK525_15875 [Candidatus Saccharimonadales bacterium]|nr:hypothetical protein [Candidatus Saccharimonadales bacterium]
MKKAAVGFRVHSGWTALVVLSVENGVPAILARQRLQLVNTFSYRYRQPYHTAEKMRGQQAAEFVSQIRRQAEALAGRSLRAVKIDLRKRGYQLECGGLLLASGRALPELEKILKSHALIHTADGELFRDALRTACARGGVKLRTVRERELLTECAGSFSASAPELLRQVTQMGRSLGAPWAQDEKFATLASWLALSSV